MKTVLEALRDTEKQYKSILTRITKEQGVTIAEWQLLNHVSEGFDTQDKLSEETGLDNSTLSRQLSSLLKKELVSNIAVGRDRRQLIYELTLKGSDVLKAVNQQHTHYEETIFKLWSAEEKSMARILLNRLENSLSKQM
ncbi:MarR family winged helix-turn-helix transcriptional regulator [Weissella confusa]|uniref:MarR family winged helix-turn-helix transcriptional regulator n=1 Tax=Weissella confusa TaxID=1583 RepID=UPI0018F14A01|nr:MarR family transcriptional regulator [Weissella confusa]MBJ7615944.1 MarR family transcriptional regulator [Weissella confusa]